MENINMSKDGYLEITIGNNRRVEGYVTSGGRGKDYLVHQDILPSNFFDDFLPGKFLYYEETNEVVENYNFVPPEEGNFEDDMQGTVSQEEFESLKNELEEMKKLLEQLTGGK